MLQRIYRKYGIKKRSIRFTKTINKHKADEYLQLKEEMIQKLYQAKNNKSKIVYIDETMFTRATVPQKEYTLQGKNLNIEDRKLNEPTLALLLGISFENGVEHF